MKFNLYDLFEDVNIPEKLLTKTDDYNEITLTKKIKKKISLNSSNKARKLILVAVILLLFAGTVFGVSRTDFFKNIFKKNDSIEFSILPVPKDRLSNEPNNGVEIRYFNMVQKNPQDDFLTESLEGKIEIKDKDAVKKIGEYLSKSRDLTEDEKKNLYVKNHPGNQFNSYGVIYFKDENGVRHELKYYENPSDYFSYVNYKGENFIPQDEFFHLMRKLKAYGKTLNMTIPSDSKKLLESRNLHPDILINTQSVKLPKNFKMGIDKEPFERFYIYMNEFSKDIDLDYSKYAGKKVTVESISLKDDIDGRYKLGDYYKAVILKHNQKIIGAFLYLDGGINRSLSLNKKSFDDITNLSENDWLKRNYDYLNKRYDKYKNLPPEKAIEKYINLTVKQQIKEAELFYQPDIDSLISKYINSAIYPERFTGMMTYELPDGDNMNFNNIESQMKKYSEKNFTIDNPRITHLELLSSSSKYEKCYDIVINTHIESGSPFDRPCMKKDNQLGWKIVSFGY